MRGRRVGAVRCEGEEGGSGGEEGKVGKRVKWGRGWGGMWSRTLQG